ncbi:hypothetical protein [Actinomadura gamaensis]|uniref:Uncharacterized protein n=1 Tax=Actinomadura gamaensis TaxID=1763541 RepID=A0ABV9TTH4_9ACTN
MSVSTLFNFFPDGKEALVFDEDTSNEAALVSAVTDRPAGRTVHTRAPRFADSQPDPIAAIDQAFTLLEQCWNAATAVDSPEA